MLIVFKFNFLWILNLFQTRCPKVVLWSSYLFTINKIYRLILIPNPNPELVLWVTDLSQKVFDSFSPSNAFGMRTMAQTFVVALLKFIASQLNRIQALWMVACILMRQSSWNRFLIPSNRSDVLFSASLSVQKAKPDIIREVKHNSYIETIKWPFS